MLRVSKTFPLQKQNVYLHLVKPVYCITKLQESDVSLMIIVIEKSLTFLLFFICRDRDFLVIIQIPIKLIHWEFCQFTGSSWYHKVLFAFVRPKAGGEMIPKELQNEKKQKLGNFSHVLLLFQKVEHRTPDYNSLGTAKKGENHETMSILEFVLVHWIDMAFISF